MKKILITALIIATATPVLANSDLLNPIAVPLSAKERKALQLAKKWAGGGQIQPYLANGGKIMYVHGATIPTIVAAPFQVCDVELEQGEIVNEVVVGDSARWMVETGTAGNITHLFIKPVDSGLETSAIITTDHRVYHLRLVSQRSGYTPYVGFAYSDDIRRSAKNAQEKLQKAQEWSTTTDNAGQSTDLSKLNFNYELDGSAPWKPERVYDDGLKTYIKLPDSTSTGDMPVLLVKKGDKDQLVNYRVKNSTMVVDGLFKTIALVTGVGDEQEHIEIRRATR